MVVSVICITFANEIKTHIGMKLYIITEINIVDYEDAERTPQVFVNEDEARNAFKERAEELYEEIKDKDDWDVDKGERIYCQYEDGYACRNSDTLRLFEVEI